MYFPQLMLLAMVAATLVFCRLASQYVHPEPTLYDRMLMQDCRKFFHDRKNDNKQKDNHAIP